ncbi:MAG TPA: hypothetical protein VFG08_11025, partial [Candidatus Polarisedimenticolia bacterium]|nr:hypothetical protein [Candidatus Polarisedimenticolia bacterium]
MSLVIHLIWIICLVAPPPRPATTHDVTVTTVRPDAEGVVAGRLLEMSIERGLRVELADTGETREVPFDEVITIRLRSEESSPRPQSDRMEIRLAGGDRILGRPVGAQNDHVEVDSRMLGRISLPLERIDRWSRGAVPARPADGGGDELPAQEDVIALSNGDAIHGMVLAIDEEGFVLEVEGGEIRVPHARIASADLVSEPATAPTGVSVRVRLI